MQTGLYVALTPMLVYTLLGTSRRLSVSPTSAISIIALNGIINALYTRQLALRYVAMLKSLDVPVEAAPCHEGDKL